MSLPLGHFPHDVLDLILSFKDMSHSSLNLWCSGDALLRQKIADGLSRVELVSKPRFNLSRFPHFLASLRSLRVLTLDRQNHGLVRMQDARSVLRRLSPTLKSLTLTFANAVSLLRAGTALPSAPTASSGSDPASKETDIPNKEDWTLKRAFPLLESLELDFASCLTLTDLSNLPPGLTSLVTPQLRETRLLSADFVAALPRTLTRYHAVGCGIDPDHFELLPPRLREFGILYVDSRAKFIAALPKLPRDLTRLSGRSWMAPSMTVDHLPQLPPGMKFIGLATPEIVPGMSESDDGGINFDFGRHFPEMEFLYSSSMSLYLAPSSLRSLPLTLTKLQMNVDMERAEPNDWPKSLRELQMVVKAEDRKFIHLLPPTLKKLTLEVYNAATYGTPPLYSLPVGLTSLTCNTSATLDETSDTAFPPNLKELKLTVSPESQRWTHVYAETTQEDPSFDDSSRVPIEVLKDALAMKTPAKVTKCFPFHKLPQSITRLCLPHAAIPASKLKYLPRQLTTLKVGAIFYDTAFKVGDTLEIAVVEQVWTQGGYSNPSLFTELCTLASSSYSPIMALLPRTLTKLAFIAAVGGDESKDWIKYLPPFLQSLKIRGPVHEDFVFEAPLSCMESLKVRIRCPTDKHILALPRHITGEILIGTQRQLTWKAIAFCPLHVEMSSYDSVLAKVNTELILMRQARMKDEDTSEYRKLLSTDISNFSALERFQLACEERF